MSIAEIYKAKRDRIPYPTKDDRKANPKAINAYRLKVDAVDKEFAEALEKETFGDDLAKIDKNKLARLWGLAWEYGHSNGYHEVAIHYEELSDLVRP